MLDDYQQYTLVSRQQICGVERSADCQGDAYSICKTHNHSENLSLLGCPKTTADSSPWLEGTHCTFSAPLHPPVRPHSLMEMYRLREESTTWHRCTSTTTNVKDCEVPSLSQVLLASTETKAKRPSGLGTGGWMVTVVRTPSAC